LTRTPAPPTDNRASSQFRPRAQLRPRIDRPSALKNTILILTDRDYAICLDIHEHRVLTSEQIFQLHFTSLGRARVRLHELTEKGVLMRFRPRATLGSHPWHYILDTAGARIVAARKEIEFEKLYFRANQLLELANSPRLAHLIDVNRFFCSLIYACRLDGGLRVPTWLGEAHTAATWDQIVRPDGFARIEGQGAAVSFFFEMDRSSEPHSRIDDKLNDYMEAGTYSDAPDALLFCFLTDQREVHVGKILWRSHLIVATTTLARHLRNPLGANWLVIGSSGRRRPLLELSSEHSRRFPRMQKGGS
jgi:protein involved in plasmid replication-relaxation